MIGILIFILVFIFIIGLLLLILRADKKDDKNISESLEDEYIVDLETGAKITLEEAESGHWIPKVVENRWPEEKIEKLPTEDEKTFRRCINYLYDQTQYLSFQLDDAQVEFLQQTIMLRKYNNWTYSDTFKIDFCEGYILLLDVLLVSHNSRLPDYQEPQLLFWLKLKNPCGHYSICEKSYAARLYEIISPPGEIKLKNYEVLIHDIAPDTAFLMSILSEFEGKNGLDIEIINDNLLIKNLKRPTMDDIRLMETILTKLRKYIK